MLLLAFSLYVFWACLINIGTHDMVRNAPDEGMRILLPQFIYNYGHLPTGFDVETQLFLFRWSYAFYPQWLGALTSAGFMHFISFFRDTPRALLVAARLGSVFYGMLSVIFINRTLRVITGNVKVSILGMSLIAFWPQFAFLSSYVNNDIVAVAGVSIMCYSIALSLKNGWSLKASIFLAIGMSVCLLAYLNSYGYVLAFGIYFLISNLWERKKESFSMKSFSINFLTVFFLVICIAGPFFIRNIVIYDGDVFGFNSFRQEELAWGAEEGLDWALKHSKEWSDYIEREWSVDVLNEWLSHHRLTMSEGRVIHDNVFDGNLGDMLFRSMFVSLTINSYIGVFGLLYVTISEALLRVYKVLMLLPLVGLFAIKKLNIRKKLFLITSVIGTLIALGLHTYYSLEVGFQPQGRYIIGTLPLLVLGISLTINWMLCWIRNRIKTEKYCFLIERVPYLLSFFLFALMVYIFNEYVLRFHF